MVQALHEPAQAGETYGAQAFGASAMRIYRPRKTDSTQRDIAKGLRACGYEVHEIKEPVDLLVGREGWGNVWMPLECKPLVGKRNPKARIRSDQPEQNDFCERFGIPRVTSFEQAHGAVLDWEEKHFGCNP